MTQQQTDEYTEPPEEVRRQMDRTVTLPATSAQTILDTLRHLDEFLRCHASAAVLDELRAFSAAQSRSAAYGPVGAVVCGVDALIDTIGFTALTLDTAIDQNRETA